MVNPVRELKATTARPAGRLDGLEHSWWRLVVIPLAVVLIDQGLKHLMIAWIGPEAETQRHELAGRFLALEYVENRGAAFGILPGQTLVLTAVALLVTVGVVGLMYREAPRHPLSAVAAGMVAGGALGNIIDRVRLGYVVDYIAVGLWPRFNLADVAITLGFGLLLWAGWRKDHHEGGEPVGREEEGANR